MKIKIENRDLFTVPHGYYLAHCISADFALGAGIALKFNELYNMRERLNFFYGKHTLEKIQLERKDYVGLCFCVDNVFNLITKEFYYQKPTYETLTSSLIEMRRLAFGLMVKKLAIPKIGCGLDRLDWSKTLSIIESVFEDTDIEILVCCV